MYVYVGIAVVSLVLVSVIAYALYTYLSKNSKKDEQPELVAQLKGDSGAYDKLVHTVGPANCTFADIIDNLGFLRSFDGANRTIVFELLNTVDVVMREVFKKPEVDSVMRGMERNLNILLENVNHDNVLVMLFVIYLCQLVPNDQTPASLASCVDNNFVGGVDLFAEIAAKEYNTLRDNVAAKSAQLVYGDVQGVNHNELVAFRHRLEAAFKQMTAKPPLTKATILQQIRTS